MPSILRVSGLTKSYRDHLAITGVSFEINAGERVGLLGLNGAGKSTTLAIVTGRLIADEGSVSILGHDLPGDREDALTETGVLPEGAPLFLERTVLGHLQTVAGLLQVDKVQRPDAIAKVIDRFELSAHRNKRIETLSKGYRRRVALAGAFLNSPKLIVLDEPTDGLDPLQKDKVISDLVQIESDQALLVSTHALDDVERLCERVLILHAGKLAYDGPVEALKARSEKGDIGEAFRSVLSETSGRLQEVAS